MFQLYICLNITQEDGLEDVRQMLRDNHLQTHRRLRGVMEELIKNIDLYTRQVGGLAIGSGSGKTKLDKHRLKMCRNTIVRSY